MIQENTEPDELPPLPEARRADPNGVGWFTAGQMRAYARAALARPSVPQEPVAWLIEFTPKKGNLERAVWLHNCIGDYRCFDTNAKSTPLYAAPVAPADAPSVEPAADDSEYWQHKAHVAELLRCELPPQGWQCSRRRGHDGPCAARPVPDAPSVEPASPKMTRAELIAAAESIGMRFPRAPTANDLKQFLNTMGGDFIAGIFNLWDANPDWGIGKTLEALNEAYGLATPAATTPEPKENQ